MKKNKHFSVVLIIFTLLLLVCVSVLWYIQKHYYYPFRDGMDIPSSSLNMMRNAQPSQFSSPGMISEEHALLIAKQNGFDDPYARVQEGFIYGKKSPRTGKVGFPTIRIISCVLNKTIHIDPVDGRVIEIDPGTNQQYENVVYCGGEP